MREPAVFIEEVFDPLSERFDHHVHIFPLADVKTDFNRAIDFFQDGLGPIRQRVNFFRRQINANP